jgi:hypothetical protein
MKRLDEGRVKDRESVKDNADREKEIQKGGDNNPPTVEDAGARSRSHQQ